MAQQKKTDSVSIDGDDLPELSKQDQTFVKCLLDGMTATDAYRTSRPGSEAQGNALWMMASRLKNSDKVKLWIMAAQKASLHSGKCTLESHMKRLEELSIAAEAAGNYGAAAQAEQLRGKAQGLYVDQIKDLTTQPTESLIEAIESTLGKDTARILAQQLGIDHEAKH